MSAEPDIAEQIERVHALRIRFWEHGYRPLPVYGPDQKVNKPGKQPQGTHWQRRAAETPPEAVFLRPDPIALNTGILCGSAIAFDVDVLDKELRDRIAGTIDLELGETPLVRIGNPPKSLFLYRADQPFSKIETPEFIMPDGTKAQVEVLAAGQQFVADGIHPDTRQPYRWIAETPETVRLADLPPVTEELARKVVAEAETILRNAGGKEQKKNGERDQSKQPPGNGHDTRFANFFTLVKAEALANLAAWVPVLLPRARAAGTGAWRVSSKDLGRDLEEDLSIHPSGIWDYGTEEPLTAIDLVMRYGNAQTPQEAADWLASQLGISRQTHSSNGSARTATEEEEEPSEEEEPHRFRFQFTRFRDIELGDEPVYAVDKLIPRHGVAVVWGKPKCGKTFWTFDLEMHIALGWPYRDMSVEQGEVLHIACEGGPGLAMRKEAWRLHHVHDADPDTIEQIENAPFHLCKATALDLIKDVNAVVSDIAAQFANIPIKVITIDTLNRSLRGSESRDEDMAAYIRAATLLSEQFQCVVIIIHHCGHNEERPRGHSSLLGALDCLIEVKKDEQGLVYSEVEEMRDGPSGKATTNHLEVVDVKHDVNGELITSCVIVGDTSQGGGKPGKSNKRPPSPKALRFYDALTDALCVAARICSQSAGRLSVTQEEWNREIIRLGLVDGDKAKSMSALISKYRLELLASGWIGFNGGIVWNMRNG
jgi:hypothetical protein